MGWLSAIIGIVLTIIFLSFIYLGYNALWCALAPYGILGIVVFLVFFVVTLVPLIYLIILACIPAIIGIVSWD